MTAPIVPFVDLSRALAQQRELLLAAMARVVDSGWLVHGREHHAFEEELAAFVGVEHVLGVANGTDALEIALRAARTDGRRTVITVANAGGYATTAARAAGLSVRHVDVDRSTHLLDGRALAGVLDDDVFAVVVTHLYGRVADMSAIRAALAGRDVAIVEDCAQSIGARLPEATTGSLGDIATFSFYPTKNLGALGDGGAIATSNLEYAERVRALRQYGWGPKYVAEAPGGRNSRLDELQAAILRARLPLVTEGNATRRAIIARYAGAATQAVRVLPAEGPHHVGHLAVVVTDRAGDLADHLGAAGVQTAVHYPLPDHQQPTALDEQGTVPLPVTEGLVGRILTLPCFPEMTDDEVDRVCEALSSYGL